MIHNLLETLFATNSRPDLVQKHEVAVHANDIKQQSPLVSEKPQGKYDTDVDALQEKYGVLTPGLHIEVGLQDILKICPRTRRRIEAYQGLVSFLKTKLDVTLAIRSRKTRQRQEE